MTSATPRRRKAVAPRPYHHGDLRDALLAQALVIIREQGPSAFTLREAARRAGVSHAAPYRHFSDRKALLTAIAAEGSRELGARIQRALDAAGPDLRGRFLAAGHAYVRFAIDRPAHFQVMFAKGDIDTDDPAVVEARDATFGILLRFIRDAQALGRFVEGSPEALAVPVWAMHHGLATLAAGGALHEVDADALRAIVDAAHEALLDGMLVK